MHTGANTQVPASNKTLTNSRWRITIFQISSGWHLCTQRLGYIKYNTTHVLRILTLDHMVTGHFAPVTFPVTFPQSFRPQSAEYGRCTREFFKKITRNKVLKTALHARDLVEFCHTLQTDLAPLFSSDIPHSISHKSK